MDNFISKKVNNKSRYCAFEKNIKRLSLLAPNTLGEVKIPREEAIAQGFKKMVNDGEHELYYELLIHLYNQRCKKILCSPKYLTALARICFFKDKFINEIHTWERPSSYIDKQFPSLLRHLFAKYEMPLFFDSVWFEESAIHQTWYTEVAQGKNIRKCQSLPIELSKKMSFHFMSAPARLKVNDAFKWAQLMILGGDIILTQQILRINFDGGIRMSQELWNNTIQFLSNNDRIPESKVREVFDYITHRGQNRTPFSYKGRTVNSLIRLSDEWHETLVDDEGEEEKNEPIITWDKSYIGDYCFRLSKQKRREKIDVIELLNSSQLKSEGKRMKHCVGTYSNACKKRHVAIFSIRKGLKTLATIEVRLKDRKIIQARASCNQPISDFTKSILKKWADKNSLSAGTSAY